MDLIELSRALQQAESGTGETLLDEFKRMVDLVVRDQAPNSQPVRVLAAVLSAVRKAAWKLDEMSKERLERGDEIDEEWGRNVERSLQDLIQQHVDEQLQPEKPTYAWSRELAPGADPASDLVEGSLVLIGDAVEGFRMFVRQMTTYSISVAMAGEKGVRNRLSGMLCGDGLEDGTPIGGQNAS